MLQYLCFADMAELADAHGSGPCESNFMQVQVLLSAPKNSAFLYFNSLFDLLSCSLDSKVLSTKEYHYTICILILFYLPLICFILFSLDFYGKHSYNINKI